MIQSQALMESNLSLLSSLKEEFRPEDYILPHYKEAYRLAIDSLISGGRQIYQEFIQAEKIVSFLSEDEIQFITQNVETLPFIEDSEDKENQGDEGPSTGTYWPTHSDAPPPDLELGWPEAIHSKFPTSIELLYHPPRLNSPTIKEVLRKHIQEARQVIAIAMDVFTDVDIFKEVVDASVRGVPVYILLDHMHLKCFLTMTSNSDTQIQKLRNMRVRSVKGKEYICSSGAKFHGAMGQKFVLIDCQTVFFGSYSFMWSYEKIHLSMVQVITGRLVDSYDEEFRTLYARSTVPAEFQPQELFSERMLNGKTDGYLSHPIKAFERKNHLRHTLDSVYRQTCERQQGFKSTLEDLPIPISYQRFLQDGMDYKRHSYAGEWREPSHPIQHTRYGSSNWNVAEDNRHNAGNHFSGTMENTYENPKLNLINRNANFRQSFHGHDKQVLSMQQKLPSLASTSKSFLRTWRIESYLNNSDAPPGEPYDHMDQYEQENKPVPLLPSRLRSSLVFRSIIPEDPEPNSYTNDSSVHRDNHYGMQSSSQYFPSTQWNQKELLESHVQPDDILKRRSIQVPDYSTNSYSLGKDAKYASLSGQHRFQVKEPELSQDNLYKRHSVADPRHTTYNSHNKEIPSHLYDSLFRSQTNKSQLIENVRCGGYSQNLKEDQRSLSHYDFKKAEIKDLSHGIWQEPPARTVSTTVLEMEEKEQKKPSALRSPRFFKRSTKKIKSLLNISDKRDGSPKRKNTLSPKMDGSTDTITSDDNEQRTQKYDILQNSTAISIHSTDSSRLGSANGKIAGSEYHASNFPGDSSAPRFGTREPQRHNMERTSEQLYSSANHKSDSVQTTSSQWQQNRGGSSRLFSRFDAFEAKHASLEHSSTNVATNSHTHERQKSSILSRTTNFDQNKHVAQQSHGHEKKFGSFFQRVGNLINKNK